MCSLVILDQALLFVSFECSWGCERTTTDIFTCWLKQKSNLDLLCSMQKCVHWAFYVFGRFGGCIILCYFVKWKETHPVSWVLKPSSASYLVVRGLMSIAERNINLEIEKQCLTEPMISFDMQIC